jgi:hypothetical protein
VRTSSRWHVHRMHTGRGFRYREHRIRALAAKLCTRPSVASAASLSIETDDLCGSGDRVNTGQLVVRSAQVLPT